MNNIKHILCLSLALCVPAINAFSGYQGDIQVHIRRNRGVAPNQPTGTQLSKQLIERFKSAPEAAHRAAPAILLEQENVRVINSADLGEVSFVAFHAHGELMLPGSDDEAVGSEQEDEVGANDAEQQESDANEDVAEPEVQNPDADGANEAEQESEDELVAEPEIPMLIAVIDGETVWVTAGQPALFVEHIALNTTADGNLIATLCVHGTNDNIYYTFGDKTLVVPESDLDAVILLVKVDGKTGQTLDMEAYPVALPEHTPDFTM